MIKMACRYYKCDHQKNPVLQISDFTFIVNDIFMHSYPLKKFIIGAIFRKIPLPKTKLWEFDR